MHTETRSRLGLFSSIKKCCNSRQATNPKISIRTKREAMKAPIPLSSQTLRNCPSHQLWAKPTITSMWFPDTGQISFVTQIHATWSGAPKREASIPMLTWTVRWHQAQAELNMKPQRQNYHLLLTPPAPDVVGSSVVSTKNPKANPDRSRDCRTFPSIRDESMTEVSNNYYLTLQSSCPPF